MTTVPTRNADAWSWVEANQAYLEAELRRVRARLEAHASGTTPPALGDGTGGIETKAWQRPPALVALVEAFALTGFERDVLLLAAGSELDGAFASALTAAPGATDRPGSERRGASFSLALEVLPEAHWSALSPAGPLRRLAQRIEAAASWDDLILPERQIEALSEIAVHLRQRSRVYETWGFAAKGKRGQGVTALFAGPAAPARPWPPRCWPELQLDLYRIDLSAVVSKYIGETEKNLRRVFDAPRWRRDPALRRGRRPVRQAQRGQGQPRPLRQHRGQLPACSAWRPTAAWRS
jgi:hypothetical protein